MGFWHGYEHKYIQKFFYRESLYDWWSWLVPLISFRFCISPVSTVIPRRTDSYEMKKKQKIQRVVSHISWKDKKDFFFPYSKKMVYEEESGPGEDIDVFSLKKYLLITSVFVLVKYEFNNLILPKTVSR